jgi:predicted ABC-type ATPase
MHWRPVVFAGKVYYDKLMYADHPILVLVRGLTGSGKSYLAQAVKKAIGADSVVVVDPDATDYKSQEYLDMSGALTRDGVDAKFHPYRFVRAQAHKGIEHHQVVIWNQAFTNLDGFNKTIINLQDHAKEHGTHLPLLVVEVEIDPAIARARVHKRAAEGGHDVPDEAFARFVNDYRSFANEGFNTVVVRGEDDIAESVATVVKAIEALKET